MATIGTFTTSEDGSLSGSIKTLMRCDPSTGSRRSSHGPGCTSTSGESERCRAAARVATRKKPFEMPF